MNRLAKVILWCLLTLISVSAVGCHTIHGAGEDVESVGRAVERAAN